MITLRFQLPRNNIVVEMLNKKKDQYRRHKKCESIYLLILETFHVTMTSGSI